MFQLMPLPLTVSCFSKIQIGFAFLVPAHLGSPGKMAVKRVCVCVWWHKYMQCIIPVVFVCFCYASTHHSYYWWGWRHYVLGLFRLSVCSLCINMYVPVCMWQTYTNIYKRVCVCMCSGVLAWVWMVCRWLVVLCLLYFWAKTCLWQSVLDWLDMLLGTEGKGSRAGEVGSGKSWRSDRLTTEATAGMYCRHCSCVR